MTYPPSPINRDSAAARLIVGCGYLGRRIAGLWRSRGLHVFATTRSRADELRAAGFEPVVADVLDPTSLGALPEAATVVYCVGLDRSAGRSMRDVYVDGLANVLAVLPRSNRLIYVSSTSVYGQTDGGEVDESASTEPQEDSGHVVLEAERLLHRERPDAIILRFAGIYGPGRLLRRKAALEASEPIPGDPDRWLNLIHVDDGAATVLAAEERALAGEVYNVCDNTPLRRRDYFAQLAARFGTAPPVFSPGPDRGANRRITNRKMCSELGVVLKYPNCADGLAAVNLD